MKKICLSLLIIISLFIITGCDETKNINNNNQSTSTSVEETKENKYAEDDVVNKFITLYNSSSFNLMEQIEKGNVRTKYYGYILNHRIEMINANSATAGYFSISIYGSNDEQDIDNILAIYNDVVKIVDDNITEKQVEESVTMMKKSSIMIENYEITENIKITYIPVVQLSNSKSNCRIDINAYNFK